MYIMDYVHGTKIKQLTTTEIELKLNWNSQINTESKLRHLQKKRHKNVKFKLTVVLKMSHPLYKHSALFSAWICISSSSSDESAPLPSSW